MLNIKHLTRYTSHTYWFYKNYMFIFNEQQKLIEAATINILCSSLDHSLFNMRDLNAKICMFYELVILFIFLLLINHSSHSFSYFVFFFLFDLLLSFVFVSTLLWPLIWLKLNASIEKMMSTMMMKNTQKRFINKWIHFSN